MQVDDGGPDENEVFIYMAKICIMARETEYASDFFFNKGVSAFGRNPVCCMMYYIK